MSTFLESYAKVHNNMKDALKALNLLQDEGIIKDYAIGGAVAAFFYIEPTLTDDMDVFIVLDESENSLITLAPVYNRLKELGYTEFKQEGLVIDKWPVQFLPASSGLEKEALRNATNEIIEGESVRVFTAEYLMALCVSVGRAKDKIRLSQFVSEKCCDFSLFENILKKYALTGKWEKIKELVSDD